MDSFQNSQSLALGAMLMVLVGPLGAAGLRFVWRLLKKVIGRFGTYIKQALAWAARHVAVHTAIKVAKWVFKTFIWPILAQSPLIMAFVALLTELEAMASTVWGWLTLLILQLAGLPWGQWL